MQPPTDRHSRSKSRASSKSAAQPSRTPAGSAPVMSRPHRSHSRSSRRPSHSRRSRRSYSRRSYTRSRRSRSRSRSYCRTRSRSRRRSTSTRRSGSRSGRRGSRNRSRSTSRHHRRTRTRSRTRSRSPRAQSETAAGAISNQYPKIGLHRGKRLPRSSVVLATYRNLPPDIREKARARSSRRVLTYPEYMCGMLNMFMKTLEPATEMHAAIRHLAHVSQDAVTLMWPGVRQWSQACLTHIQDGDVEWTSESLFDKERAYLGLWESYRRMYASHA